MRHLRVSTLAVVLTLIAVPALAQGIESAENKGQVHVTAIEKVAALGVASYRLDIADNSAEVELLSPEKSAMGRLLMSWDMEEGNLIELDQPEANLLLFFHPLGNELRFTDLRTGDTATGRLTEDGWVLDEKSQQLLELYAEEIARISEIHDDVYFNHVEEDGIEEWLEAQPIKEGPGTNAGDKLFNQCPPICNGSTVRGSNIASLSRSACCQKAKDNANLKCWNSHCTGCCFFYSCDANCALGDFLCAPCGITGRRCSGFPSNCCI